MKSLGPGRPKTAESRLDENHYAMARRFGFGIRIDGLFSTLKIAHARSSVICELESIIVVWCLRLLGLDYGGTQP